jgi:hypothetical protein
MSQESLVLPDCASELAGAPMTLARGRAMEAAAANRPTRAVAGI